jgi:hypothetical protein
VGLKSWIGHWSVVDNPKQHVSTINNTKSIEKRLTSVNEGISTGAKVGTSIGAAAVILVAVGVGLPFLGISAGEALAYARQ